MNELRVGVIGTNPWAELVHYSAIAAHPRASLAAVCGRNPERAQEVADKYGAPEIYQDYKKMIDSGHLDAVIVVAPDDLHHAMVMRALEADLHVVCEKPLALSVSEATEMTETADERGLKNMMFFTQRWFPQRRYARDLIEEGCVGAVLDAHFQLQAGFGRDLPSLPPWTYDPARCHGILGNLASHIIDHARLFVGEIDRVCASIKTQVPQGTDPGLSVRPNNAVLLMLEFTNGAHGTIHVSDVALAGTDVQFTMTLHGEDGAIEGSVCASGQDRLQYMTAGHASFEDREVPDHYWEGIDRDKPFHEQLVQIFSRPSVGDGLFINSVLDDGPVCPTFSDGLAVQRVIHAALLSDQEKRWVDIAPSLE